MAIDPIYHKIFGCIASHGEMFELLNQSPDGPPADRVTGQAHAGRWFEILQHSYDVMLEVLPPLFMRHDMFAMSELHAGTVGAVFFEIVIRRTKRWFVGFCDLADRGSPDRMRAAIILWETGDTTGFTRAQKLDAIWSITHARSRGSIDAQHRDHADRIPPEKRTILIYELKVGTVLKRLEDLTDEEIAYKLPKSKDP